MHLVVDFSCKFYDAFYPLSSYISVNDVCRKHTYTSAIPCCSPHYDRNLKKKLCLKITRPLFHSKYCIYFKKTCGYQFFVCFLLSIKLSSLDIKACSIKIDFQQIQNLSNFLHYRKYQVLNFIHLIFFSFEKH